MSHDQNFKNFLLDHLHQAVTFFAATEAHAIGTERITPVHQSSCRSASAGAFGAGRALLVQ